jgi:hypothetical protein
MLEKALEQREFGATVFIAYLRESPCWPRLAKLAPRSGLNQMADGRLKSPVRLAQCARGARVLKTPVRAPKANAVCERLVGTIRRECLDFLIPFGERHLKQVLTNWAAHDNHARVHTSLGPGVPDRIRPSPPMSTHRHRLPAGHVLQSEAVLGGLHHEYWLEKVAA